MRVVFRHYVETTRAIRETNNALSFSLKRAKHETAFLASEFAGAVPRMTLIIIRLIL